MRNLVIEIKKGKELPKSFINEWNRIMYKTFKSKPLSNFEKNIFFILKKGKKIVALGELFPLTINYLSKNYNIFGIGGITALVRKKGYGKSLIQGMIDYLRKRGKTGLGFCSKKNTLFYKKAGLKTKKELGKRFYCHKIKDEKNLSKRFHCPKSEGSGDGIYHEGKDNFLKKVLSTKSNICLNKPLW
ncbi:MAG: GNAT family N-acetyltransferase [Nanoarchaeota archaeon]|nr:GNAT family N-acetyltransferase [Nanoarchaeota archaeon]